jgi:hypothetical protein
MITCILIIWPLVTFENYFCNSCILHKRTHILIKLHIGSYFYKYIQPYTNQHMHYISYLIQIKTCITFQAGSGATRLREEEPAGSVKRRAGELGARWRRKSGEEAAGGWGNRHRWAVGGAAEK